MLAIESACVKRFARAIVEVVLWVEVFPGVVALAKVLNISWFTDAVVLTCYVIRHEIDDDL